MGFLEPAAQYLADNGDDSEDDDGGDDGGDDDDDDNDGDDEDDDNDDWWRSTAVNEYQQSARAHKHMPFRSLAICTVMYIVLNYYVVARN